MKTILCAAICLFASLAFADDNRDQAIAWAKSFVEKTTPIPDHQGKISSSSYFEHKVTGKTCTLRVVFDERKNLKYLTVGNDKFVGSEEQKEREAYVGIGFTSDLKAESRNNSYLFERPGTWSPKVRTQFNRIIVDVDGSGNPVHVTGVSDRQTIDCELN